ncbi:hypothetical protein BD309DRAFT_971681 [Dichomitus squalens]|nr:hypothetical protein BD309DRAFT_971681 [Dichomitus squalens]
MLAPTQTFFIAILVQPCVSVLPTPLLSTAPHRQCPTGLMFRGPLPIGLDMCCREPHDQSNAQTNANHLAVPLHPVPTFYSSLAPPRSDPPSS